MGRATVRIPNAPIYVTHETKTRLGWSETIYPMAVENRAQNLYLKLKGEHPRDRVAVLRRKPSAGWMTKTTIGKA